MTATLKPCPSCGGSVKLERTTSYYNELHGERQWWGVVCRNTINSGGTCCIQQVPSASEHAAVERWNRRAPTAPDNEIREAVNALCKVANRFHGEQQLRDRIANIVVPLVKPEPQPSSHQVNTK